MTRHVATIVAVAGLLVAAGCSSNSNPAPAPGGPTTETFASHVAPNGVTAHGFKTSESGTIIVTLSSVTPAVVVGLGLGVPPTSSGDSCNLTKSIETAGGAGAQITAPADKGSYCVEVYDVGNLSAAVGPKGQGGFSVTIVYP